MAPKITLYFLQASRCIRTAWLLEALGLDYNVEFSPRVNGVAPPDFKQKAGGLGKFPSLVDGDLVLYESGNITEYLCDTYDTQHNFLPPVGDRKRYEVLQWVHASEGTFALHGLTILYTRWFQQGGDKEATEEAMSKQIIKDMDYLESTLGKSSGKFLHGDDFSAADIMTHFSAVFVLARKLGMKDRSLPKVEQWIRDCEATESYQKAVKKTGHEI